MLIDMLGFVLRQELFWKCPQYPSVEMHGKW